VREARARDDGWVEISDMWLNEAMILNAKRARARGRRARGCAWDANALGRRGDGGGENECVCVRETDASATRGVV